MGVRTPVSIVAERRVKPTAQNNLMPKNLFDDSDEVLMLEDETSSPPTFAAGLATQVGDVTAPVTPSLKRPRTAVQTTWSRLRVGQTTPTGQATLQGVTNQAE